MNRVVACAIMLFASCSLLHAQLAGTWTLYPPQAQSYQVSIDPPINADGTSVWPVKATIPVQYDLLIGYGPVVFESLVSGYNTNPNVFPAFSNLDFKPSSAITFSQLNTLNAVFTFTSGNCYGGTPRWSILFNDNTYMYVYYGSDSTFWQDCTSNLSDTTISQSGLNMINANFDGASGGDPRYEISANPNHYTTYDNALAIRDGEDDYGCDPGS
jgi:hypothetical protein